jgi:flagellar hook-associated protein 2
MASIDGLISGLDTTSLIKDILKFQQAPIDQLGVRIKDQTNRKTALLSFTGKLLGLESKANLLATAASFATPAITSSNEDVMTATGGTDLPAGTYQFRIKQLAEGAQYTSGGFATETGAVGAGTLRIDAAGGAVDRQTEIDLLNGGAGVRRGTIRITNRAGTSSLIDLSTALTIDDVLTAINSAAGLNVTAALSDSTATHPGESLVLTDSSGGAGNLKVEEVSGGGTARDLGILGSVAASTREGSAILALGDRLPLSVLNDGLGIRSRTGDDLQVTQSDGTVFTVDLSGKTSMGDVITAVNGAAGNTGVTLAVSGRRLVATDSSGGGGAFTIASVGSGSTATDLGLDVAASGSTITGDPILADFNSVLLKNLHGGQGLSAGSILITNRAGAAQSIDLSGARSLREVIDAIDASGLSVAATLNETGDGLLLSDSSGGSGPFKVEEVGGGSTASELGILQATGVDADQIQGQDLVMKYIGENTLLSSLNGGNGIFAGSIRVTDPSGRSFTVDLSQETTIGDVLSDVNGAASLVGSDVVAAVNDAGNGIVLSAASGTGTLGVAEVAGGTTARDLNISGRAPDATPLVLDGSFERSVEITADDSLESLADKINALKIGVRATIVDDGSPIAPKRLQLTSTTPGAEGGIIARTSGGTALDFSLTARGRDAVLFYGGSGGRPVVVRSTSNQFRDVVKGLNVTAKAVSDAPVSISATRDLDKVQKAVSDLVDSYNDIIDQISTLTSFDATTGTSGTLLGERALQTVQQQISGAILQPVLGLASGKNLASQAGLRVTAQGKLSFDSSAFDELASTNPQAIQEIFTRSRTLTDDVKLADFRNGEGVSSTAVGAELRIWRREGTSFDVDISGVTTVRGLLQAINQASGNGGTVTASTSSSGRSIVLTDSTTGSTTFRVDSLNGSPAFHNLGLDKSTDSTGGGTLTGREIDLKDDPGVARRLFDTLKTLLDTTNGVLEQRAENYQSTIDDLNDQVKKKTALLNSHQDQLRQQFAQLEVIMGQNQNTLQRLSAALGGLKTG